MISFFSTNQDHLKEFRLTDFKAAAIFAVFLILIGSGLDYFLYPEYFAVFTTARAINCIFILIVYGSLKIRSFIKKIKILTLIWLASIQLMIGWMIWKTAGPSSIYFAGLNLALYGVGVILPFTLFQTAGFGLFTYFVYFSACYLSSNFLVNIDQFLGHSIFLILSILLSTFCVYFNERERKQIFLLQHELSQKNLNLEQTTKSLTQIKNHMLQQEKMAALGTLSGGLLYEASNPLNYSLMALDAAIDNQVVKNNSDLQENLGDAKKGIQRIQEIISSLKTFAYQKFSKDNNRTFLLEKTIGSALHLTGFKLKGIKKIIDLPQDTHVHGVESAIISVLVNLFSNSAFALSKVTHKERCLEIRGELKEGRLYISVRDNGPGIKPEDLPKIFEPFFMTEDVEQGVGLSVSHSIIQRHGGSLRVSSEYGAWTEFSFDLSLASSKTL